MTLQKVHLLGRIVPPHYDYIGYCLMCYSKRYGEPYEGKYIYLPDKCEICGSEENLETHHIKQIIYNGSNKNKNLIRVCRKCHMKIHSGKIILVRDGKYNTNLIKKRNKLLRKFYSKYNILFFGHQPLVDKFNKCDLQFAIKKHVKIDNSFKFILKHKDTERLSILKKEWSEDYNIKFN